MVHIILCFVDKKKAPQGALSFGEVVLLKGKS
jgi:hypothetical protein